MKIYELEKLVNEKKLCCYEGLTKLNEIPEMVEQPFELWEKQEFFKELTTAEINLARCGYSIDVSWEEDTHSIEYSIYKGLLPDHRVYVTMFSGDVFSWRQSQVIAKTLCSALGIEYKYQVGEEVMKNNELFTEKQMEALWTANEGVKGTENYHIYHCEAYCKRENGTWYWIGWSLPPTEKGYFKTVKGDTYVYSEDGQKRWKLSTACIDLLSVI